MPALVLFSQRPRVGKTAVAVGLAQRLRQEGAARSADLRPRSAALIRLGPPDDDSAAADARCFASLGLAPGKTAEPLSLEEAIGLVEGAADTTFLLELPAGEAARSLDAPAILVERFADLDPVRTASLSKALGSSFAGLIVTATPVARLATVGQGLAVQGIPLLAALPEDRLLAAPTVAEMAAALDAEALFLDSHAEQIVERITIASIAADPGQGYFVQFGPQAVIVRCDKPDLQLAALHTSTLCLVLTGGRMPLAHVTERAESEDVPLLITPKDTPAAVRALEGLYASGRFSGHRKAERVAQLMAVRLDHDALRKALGSGQKS